MRKYYYSNGGDRKGPVSLLELRSLTEVTPGTLVWYEGLPSWVRAGELPDLHEVVPIPLPSEETEDKDGDDVVIPIAIMVAMIILIGLMVWRSY